jgi:DNA-binding NtrC family response regulator
VSRDRQTVLVVDDDASIRLLCRVNLELEGWRVLDAASIPDARAHVDAEAPDVVVLDVHVGTDDGVAFADELRQRHPGIAVALLTGSADPDVSGADALIPKPFTLEQLVDTVRDLVVREAPAR